MVHDPAAAGLALAMESDARKDKIRMEQKQKSEEDRLEEFAISQFEALGYTGRLPDTVVSLYKEFKKRKDILYPGRLTPEGFAFISVMADLTDRKIAIGKG